MIRWIKKYRPDTFVKGIEPVEELRKEAYAQKTLGFGRPRLPMTLEQRHFLTEAFREEIVFLESLLKRYLSRSWLHASEGRCDRNEVSTSEAEM